MTRSTLRTNIRYLLAETATDFYTDQKLNVAIYEAMIDMAKKTKAIRGTTTTSSVAGTAEYAYPSYCVGINDITWGTTEEWLNPVSVSDLDRDYPGWRQTSAGHRVTPEYFLTGYTTNYYRLYPAPEDTTSHKVYWWGIPADLASDTSSPTFNEAYHMGLVYYATWWLIMADPDADESKQKTANFWRSEYERYCIDYGVVLASIGRGPHYILSTSP